MATHPTEIGGEFPIGETPGTPAGFSVSQLPAVGAPVFLLRSGRDAMRAWLETQRGVGRDQLLLPAYLCEAILQAANAAWDLHFYAVDGELSPDPDRLVDLGMGQPDRSCAIVIQPFGFPFRPAGVEAVRRLREAGVAILEDRTHALFSEACHPLSTVGAASLRKWMPLPDGGLLYGAIPRRIRGTHADTLFAVERWTAMTAKSRWISSGEGSKQRFRAQLEGAERWLDAQVDVRPMSEISNGYLQSADLGWIIGRRRDNYRTLLDAVGELPGVEPVFPALPEGVCPLGMPVRLKDRDRVRNRLASQGVYCPIHWDLPASVPMRFATEHQISDSLLTLPCDQRYERADMERQGAALGRATEC